MFATGDTMKICRWYHAGSPLNGRKAVSIYFHFICCFVTFTCCYEFTTWYISAKRTGVG